MFESFHNRETDILQAEITLGLKYPYTYDGMIRAYEDRINIFSPEYSYARGAQAQREYIEKSREILSEYFATHDTKFKQPESENVNYSAAQEAKSAKYSAEKRIEEQKAKDGWIGESDNIEPSNSSYESTGINSSYGSYILPPSYNDYNEDDEDFTLAKDSDENEIENLGEENLIRKRAFLLFHFLNEKFNWFIFNIVVLITVALVSEVIHSDGGIPNLFDGIGDLFLKILIIVIIFPLVSYVLALVEHFMCGIIEGLLDDHGRWDKEISKD